MLMKSRYSDSAPMIEALAMTVVVAGDVVVLLLQLCVSQAVRPAKISTPTTLMTNCIARSARRCSPGWR